MAAINTLNSKPQFQLSFAPPASPSLPASAPAAPAVTAPAVKAVVPPGAQSSERQGELAQLMAPLQSEVAAETSAFEEQTAEVADSKEELSDAAAAEEQATKSAKEAQLALTRMPGNKKGTKEYKAAEQKAQKAAEAASKARQRTLNAAMRLQQKIQTAQALGKSVVGLHKKLLGLLETALRNARDPKEIAALKQAVDAEQIAGKRSSKALKNFATMATQAASELRAQAEATSDPAIAKLLLGQADLLQSAAAQQSSLATELDAELERIAKLALEKLQAIAAENKASVVTFVASQEQQSVMQDSKDLEEAARIMRDLHRQADIMRHSERRLAELATVVLPERAERIELLRRGFERRMAQEAVERSAQVASSNIAPPIRDGEHVVKARDSMHSTDSTRLAENPAARSPEKVAHDDAAGVGHILPLHTDDR